MIQHLADFFLQGALRDFPTKVALVDRQEQYTFADWDRLARTFAAAIVQKGAAANTPISVLLPKSAIELIVDLGILFTGNLFSNMDCGQPVQRLVQQLDNFSPTLVIAGRDQVKLAAELEIPMERLLIVEEVLQCAQPVEHDVLNARRKEILDTDPACIINTSGSTGVPKSCALSHRGLIDFVLWFDDEFGLGHEEVVGSLSPYHFDGYIPGLFMALFRGATLNVVPTELAMFPIRLAEYLATHRISFIFWVPTVMVNMANLDVFREIHLPALKTVCFAGEVFPTRHLNYWRRHLPHAQFVNLYGPIEISVICTYFIVNRDFHDEEPLPIGFPCRNTGILVLNEAEQACAQGEPGELCVRGGSLALGYWNNPERTAAAFTQNPLQAHYPELIYRTGDIVYQNDRGELMFVGRRDFQIKHLGNRIELGEIETRVLALEEIRNACVVYDPDKKEIVLFYESHGQDIAPGRIRERLLKQLPKYMLPTVYHRYDELPRNPNGKLDRKKLMEMRRQHN